MLRVKSSAVWHALSVKVPHPPPFRFSQWQSTARIIYQLTS